MTTPDSAKPYKYCHSSKKEPINTTTNTTSSYAHSHSSNNGKTHQPPSSLIKPSTYTMNTTKSLTYKTSTHSTHSSPSPHSITYGTHITNNSSKLYYTTYNGLESSPMKHKLSKISKAKSPSDVTSYKLHTDGLSLEHPYKTTSKIYTHYSITYTHSTLIYNSSKHTLKNSYNKEYSEELDTSWNKHTKT